MQVKVVVTFEPYDRFTIQVVKCSYLALKHDEWCLKSELFQYNDQQNNHQINANGTGKPTSSKCKEIEYAPSQTCFSTAIEIRSLISSYVSHLYSEVLLCAYTPFKVIVKSLEYN